MTGVVELRDFLLGAGAFVGLSAAGLGAGRFFMRATISMLTLPSQMERCVAALESTVAVMREHNAMGHLLVELRNRVVETRDELIKDRAEHEQLRRELRILSRRMEGEKNYAQISD